MFHRLRELPAGARHILFKDRGGLRESDEVVTYESVASNETEKSRLNITWYVVLYNCVSFLQASGRYSEYVMYSSIWGLREC